MKKSLFSYLMLLVYTALLSFLSSCDKEDPPQPIQPMYGVNASDYVNMELKQVQPQDSHLSEINKKK